MIATGSNIYVWSDSTNTSDTWTSTGTNDWVWMPYPVACDAPEPEPVPVSLLLTWPVDLSGRQWLDQDVVESTDAEVTWPGWCRAPPPGAGLPT